MTLYWHKLADSITPTGYDILVDSAFPRFSEGLHGKLIRARKSNESSHIPESQSLAAIDSVLEVVMTLKWQSVE